MLPPWGDKLPYLHELTSGGMLRAVCSPCRMPAAGPDAGAFAIGPRLPLVMEGSVRHKAPPTSMGGLLGIGHHPQEVQDADLWGHTLGCLQPVPDAGCRPQRRWLRRWPSLPNGNGGLRPA